MSNTCFITGISRASDTVGVVIRLASLAVEKGFSTAVMKPVQMGTSDPLLGALGQIRAEVPGLLDVPVMDACCYSFDGFELPVISAEQNGIEIDLRRINGAWQNILDGYSPDLILMESSGGPLEPFSGKLLAGNIPERLELPVILVTGPGPDAVSSTLLALEWFEKHETEVVCIVSDGSGYTEEVLKRLVKIPVIAGLDDPKLTEILQEVL